MNGNGLVGKNPANYWIWKRREPLVGLPGAQFFDFGWDTIIEAHNNIRGEDPRHPSGQLRLKFHRPEFYTCEGNYHYEGEGEGSCVENVCKCKNGLGKME